MADNQVCNLVSAVTSRIRITRSERNFEEIVSIILYHSPIVFMDAEPLTNAEVSRLLQDRSDELAKVHSNVPQYTKHVCM